MISKDTSRKLKMFYESLREQQKVYADLKDTTVVAGTFRMLENEVASIRQEFPGLLPVLNGAEFDLDTRGQFYDVTAIKTYLGTAIARLKVALEDETKDGTVVEKLDFNFVRNANLREILERDFDEA